MFSQVKSLTNCCVVLVLVTLITAGSANRVYGQAGEYINSPQDSLGKSVADSLLSTMNLIYQERSELASEIDRLKGQLQSLDRGLSSRIETLHSLQNNHNAQINVQFDTLRAIMPSDEPIETAGLYLQYLNRRQDTLIVYVETLENRLEELSDNQFWGLRHDFKEFDHLLLFTFLGAIMSLGLALLLRGDTKKNNHEGIHDAVTEYLHREDAIDRLSISITLLVGSILVILFIIFIL